MLLGTRIEFEKRATSIGTYWVGRADKAILRDHLRSLSLTRFKQASIGGEQEQGFEQAFSSLAYAYLKDKSPRLLDFIVGFQLVDRNEDNTKAIGIFGFKVGDQWLYAPTFFLNGDLKGHELLYIKKQDAFVPMKENWVNYLISRRPHVLGEGSEQDTFGLGGLTPNLSRFRSPMTSKYGADAPLPVFVADWAKPALPLVMALATKSARGLYPEHVKAASAPLDMKKVAEAPFKAALAPFAAKFDMRNFLSTFPLLKSAFEKCYMAYPLIKKGFDRFYGPNFFREMGEKFRADANDLTKSAESFVLPPTKKRAKKLRPSPFSLIDDPAPPEKKGELYVYALDVDNDVPITENKPELDEEERKKLLRDTVLIKDEREDASIAYNTQVKLELVNPSETGIYEVLEKPGQFTEMVIINNPQTGRGRENFCLVVRKGDTRNWLNGHRSNLWVRASPAAKRETLEKYVDGLGSTDSLEKGGCYIALHANGSGTCPFTIKESFGDGVYKVRWHDDVALRDCGRLYKTDRPQDWEVGYSPWDAKIFINKRKGTGLKSVNGELSIPDSYKIIKVSDPPKPKKEDDGSLLSCCSYPESGSGAEGSKEQPILPGNLVDIQVMLKESADTLKIRDTGAGEVWLMSTRGQERMSKKAALLSLVRDHGLREVQAREMLKEATVLSVHNEPAVFYVKYAYSPNADLMQGAPGAPAFPEAERGTEQMGYNSVNSIYPQEEYMPVEGMEASRTDPSVYDPFYMPDQGAMQVAQQAAGSGQKEVFDTAMISGMLKSVRQDTLVDRYLGDLMKALDKLGRILFMFYWHQEEFEERYGKQDLPEMEDSLRNAFEVLGDVCLFLQEKTVQGGAGMMNVFGDAPGPNLQEAARN